MTCLIFLSNKKLHYKSILHAARFKKICLQRKIKLLHWNIIDAIQIWKTKLIQNNEAHKINNVELKKENNQKNNKP